MWVRGESQPKPVVFLSDWVLYFCWGPSCGWFCHPSRKKIGGGCSSLSAAVTTSTENGGLFLKYQLPEGDFDGPAAAALSQAAAADLGRG